MYVTDILDDKTIVLCEDFRTKKKTPGFVGNAGMYRGIFTYFLTLIKI